MQVFSKARWWAVCAAVMLPFAGAGAAGVNPVTVKCAMHGMAGSITLSLNEKVTDRLNENIRETLKLYNLECLENMVHLGGLGDLGIAWPDIFDEACKAILDKLTMTGEPLPPPGQLFTEDRLVAALRSMPKADVGEASVGAGAE